MDLASLVPAPPAPVRVSPAPLHRLGPLALAVALGSARVSGHGPLHVFTTLGRDPSLFRAWLVFSGKLLSRGRLPRRDTELVILRVAHGCGSGYEWRQHVAIGRGVGLTEAEVAGAAGVGEPAFTARQSALLAATDELLAARSFTDATWAALREHLDQRDVVELCLLVGQYQGLATALGGLGVAPERAS